MILKQLINGLKEIIFVLESVQSKGKLKYSGWMKHRYGQMIHCKELTAEFALKYLDSTERRPPPAELLEKGREAYEMIKSELLHEMVR